MALNSKQRAHLKSLAHHLKPLHHVGKEGLSTAALDAIDEAFATRELLKIKVQESAPLTAKEASAQVPEKMEGVHLVQTIGRTVVLYREHPDKPEIRLP